MKFLAAFIGLLLISISPIRAQSIGGSAFGAPVIKVTQINNHSSLLVGGKAGWVINKHIVLGGGIYSLVSRVESGMYDSHSGKPLKLGFNYGGLEFEYMFLPDNPLDFSVDMLFAGGGLKYSVSNGNPSTSDYLSQDLLVWEPSAYLGIRVIKWLHIDLGLSYRIISSFQEIYSIKKSDLQGLSFVMLIKFGNY